MKLWIIMIVVMFAIIVGALYMENSIIRTTNRLSESLDVVKENVRNGQWSEALRHHQKIDEQWQIQKRVWSPLIHNEDLDVVAIHLARLKVFIETQEKGSALAEITMIEIQLVHLNDQEVLTIQNVL